MPNTCTPDQTQNIATALAAVQRKPIDPRRFEAAKAAMTGLLATNPDYGGREIAILAVAHADALLAEFEKEPTQ